MALAVRAGQEDCSIDQVPSQRKPCKTVDVTPDPPEEQIAMWRPAAGVMCIRGTTNRYAVEPNGETIVGIVTGGAMLARRRGQRHVVRAGEACIWDASSRHAGSPYGGPCWAARLIVIESPAVDELLQDVDAPARALTRLRRSDPIVRDPTLVAKLLACHRALERAPRGLASDGLLTEWIEAAAGVSPPTRSFDAARRDVALRRACELLADVPDANVTLRELAAVAGSSRHRLSRLFSTVYGMSPHRFQLAQRVRRARSLLEAGFPISEVAQRAGFADQSHFHRHFRRTLGMTPARYLRALRSDVQDEAALSI
jgi:AraC-like DNA-binding protein